VRNFNEEIDAFKASLNDKCREWFKSGPLMSFQVSFANMHMATLTEILQIVKRQKDLDSYRHWSELVRWHALYYYQVLELSLQVWLQEYSPPLPSCQYDVVRCPGSPWRGRWCAQLHAATDGRLLVPPTSNAESIVEGQGCSTFINLQKRLKRVAASGGRQACKTGSIDAWGGFSGLCSQAHFDTYLSTWRQSQGRSLRRVIEPFLEMAYTKRGLLNMNDWVVTWADMGCADTRQGCHLNGGRRASDSRNLRGSVVV